MELGQGPKFDLLNPLIPEHLEEFSSDRISGLVDETTRTALRETLAEGVRAGEAVRDLRKRVQSVFEEADKVRAETIARTEVLRSSGWATQESYKVSGVVAEREWVATPDDRTRDTHRALDGQTRKLNEPFEIDGQKAMFPGDFGDPAQDINCRCTIAAVIKDPEESTASEREATWYAFDAALLPLESEAIAALRRGFRKQELDVLEGL